MLSCTEYLPASAARLSSWTMAKTFAAISLEYLRRKEGGRMGPSCWLKLKLKTLA